MFSLSLLIVYFYSKIPGSVPPIFKNNIKDMTCKIMKRASVIEYHPSSLLFVFYERLKINNRLLGLEIYQTQPK